MYPIIHSYVAHRLSVINYHTFSLLQQLYLLEDLLRSFGDGSHILLVGNQGVGKNKLIDRLLELLEGSREYLQLHRDSTVQAITVQVISFLRKCASDNLMIVRQILALGTLFNYYLLKQSHRNNNFSRQ